MGHTGGGVPVWPGRRPGPRPLGRLLSQPHVPSSLGGALSRSTDQLA